ncbi:VOC family protein [Candidatus Latescibacterota bacterium]
MTIQKFAHIGISCIDPIATEKFYTKHFGFRRARVIGEGSDQVIFLRTLCGDLYLELFKADNGSIVHMPSTGVGPSIPGFRHMAFKVDDVDLKLKEMRPDAHITEGPYNFDDFIPGWRTVWIADPDGRIIEISQGYVDQE